MTTIYKGDDAVRLNGESADRSLKGVAVSYLQLNFYTNTINDSMNISSSTDTGTGLKTANHTNSFDNIYHAGTFGGNVRSGGPRNYSTGTDFNTANTVSTTAWAVEDSDGIGTDDSYGSGLVSHGELA